MTSLAISPSSISGSIAYNGIAYTVNVGNLSIATTRGFTYLDRRCFMCYDTRHINNSAELILPFQFEHTVNVTTSPPPPTTWRTSLYIFGKPAGSSLTSADFNLGKFAVQLTFRGAPVTQVVSFKVGDLAEINPSGYTVIALRDTSLYFMPCSFSYSLMGGHRSELKITANKKRKLQIIGTSADEAMIGV
jgi:hypothetical protein